MSNYVSDQVLDRIRQATDIAALVRNIVPLKKSGSGQIGLCPFHKEKTPSFHVNTEKQIFKCFGCGVGGDVFSFVMKTDGLSFTEAVRLLAERVHIELPENEGRGAPPGEKERLYEVNAWAASAFHWWLVKDDVGKRALKYLKDRGLSDETIKEFKLGFSPDGWDNLLKAAAKKMFGAGLLLKAGLTASSEQSDRTYDRFRNRVMFPIRDAQDRVIGFGGRSLDDSEPKYLNSPETPLFSKGRVLYALDKARAGLREKRVAVVVEGYMDAVMAHQYGVTWTVAVLGTALSVEHVRVLRRHADEAVLLFDSDNAGQSSAARSVDAFAAEEMPVRVATLPDGLDPDEFLLKNGLDEFLAQLEKSPDGVRFKLERALAASRGHTESLPGAKALDDVLATVALMPNPAAQFGEVRKIAERTGIPEHVVQQRLASLSGARPERSDGDDVRESAPTLRHAERELLLALLSHPENAAWVDKELDRDALTDPDVMKLIERTLKLAAESPAIGPAELLARTQEEELRAIVEDLVGRDPVLAADPAGWCRELVYEIKARRHDRLAGEAHRIATTTAGPSGTTTAPPVDWNASIRALREAHLARGTLHVKRSSNGGRV